MQDNSRSAAVTATGVRTGALDRHTHEVDAHPIDGEADQSIGDEPALPGRAPDRAAVIDLEKLTRALSAGCSPSTRQVGALNLGADPSRRQKTDRFREVGFGSAVRIERERVAFAT